MLSGDNSILNNATRAKDATRGGEVQETVNLAATSNAGVNYIGGTKKTRADVINELHSAGKLTDEEVSLLTDEENPVDVITIGGITTDFSVLGSASGVLTLGEAYDQSEESWIGKTINYTSANNSSAIQEAGGWIVLGKQTNEQGKNDILITTANPVSTQQINYTLSEWTGYETKIKRACSSYVGTTGTLGTKSVKINEDIKDVRSITLNDINTAVGFNQTINTVTLGGTSNEFAYPKDDGSGWVVKGEQGSNYSEWAQHPIEAYNYYNNNGYKFNSVTNGFNNASIELGKPDNMAYILANNNAYWVASRSVDVNSEGADFLAALVGYGSVNSDYYSLCHSGASGGHDCRDSRSVAFRPVVVLSSEIPYADATIGDYYEYT